MRRDLLPAIIAVSALIAACVGGTENDSPELPEVVEVFACSDNCPGPEQQYIKRVYRDVTDEAECRRLGGTPFTVVGWVQRRLCEAP